MQRYVGRALVDGSDAVQGLVDEAMGQMEAYLTSTSPDRYPEGAGITRDTAAVMTAVNTSIMVLQPMVAERMGITPWTDEAIMRIGTAMFDTFEFIADMVASDFWRKLRSGVSAYQTTNKETTE